MIGIGLILAPAIFQMFSRAPLGGTMIEDFEPYMVEAKIDTFRGYMDQIGVAVEQAADVRTSMIESGTVSMAEFDSQYVSVQQLTSGWAAINADMTDLLDRMNANMDDYAAVAALPPFPMFPWFFVLPGLLVAGVASSILRSMHKNRPHRQRLWVLAGLGVAITAAPVAFQMFTRAPMGRDMIDSFRPMMTRERVQNVQGYFVTLGGGEGQMRVTLIPAYVAAGGDVADHPAIAEFSAQWPTIVKDFNPMIATMSDNVDNFQAVDALPSFALFPWFFLVPGVLVAGLAGVALRRQSSPPSHLEAAS